ncbi:hypothetical protein TMatcc_004636 [Talaromyces marneffei ATCC 18224]|uniref:Chromosome segregation ATPase family protein n=1 Tax=Talaromyces marneffei (strain ATCC 18224 / CBS 334.59 / QM 7333) TaxID=441960 RepID=B6Q3I3_TALMQ|nr:uncharacterized protein EYB26_000434 [Talaromyces marneffei]EEA27089.1 conserved hypothetical protein [Talaromyces marneffei ATCC 18224]QGA12789.1 hypothetical protein EYB26_000434 [Talaromyces marneffei]
MASDTEAAPNGAMDLVVKSHHQHSNSEIAKLNIPMWDSSDPERRPPPLPMNPGAGSPKTRSNASPGIQAVTASLAEKMRENAPSPYTINPMPSKSSPEKSLVKGQYHRRLQSLQPTTDTRTEFRNFIENRSPERKTRSAIFNDDYLDKSPTRTGTSGSQDSGRDSPSLYVSNRYLSKPIIGENTPTSATMLALQNMQLPGDELKSVQVSVSKPATATSLPESSLSEQIQSLTEIATSLQKEMTSLTRRSKDNATDLLSLKAATNARDEDIRKSIRDLANNISSKLLDPDSASTRSGAFGSVRSGYSIDSKPFDSPPDHRKSFTLPRVASPSSFAAALERDLCGSPAPISDGSASIALLEKVLREMATKEAQEKLLELVDEVKKRPAKDGSTKEADQNVTKMLEQILNHVKENPTNRALVRSGAQGSTSPEHTRSGPIVLSQDSNGAEKSALSEDIIGLLNRIKHSVAEGGGLTSEVKALVRELRGEVLGMGREIGRKLEEAATSKSEEDIPQTLGADEVAEIVRAGLAELKEQMYSMIQEHQQTLSTSLTRSGADADEVFTAVRSALDEYSPQHLNAPAPSTVGMDKEDILEAVREAWEVNKPEIELQNFGLEREEILECLTEGLKAYQPKHEEAVTYDQVLAAVQAGMQSFVPPPIEAPPAITREEVAEAVKDCLESFELTIPEPNITKEDIYAAVSEAMDNQQRALPSMQDTPKITRDDVFEAVAEALGRSTLAESLNAAGLTRDDVYGAVVEAMAGQRALPMDEHLPQLTRDDVFEAVAQSLNVAGLTRDDVHVAVAEAMAGQRGLPTDEDMPKLTRDDVFEAVTEAMARSTLAESLAGTGLTRDDVHGAVVEAMVGQRAITQDETDTGLSRDDVFNAVTEGLAAHFAAAKEMGESSVTREDVVQVINDALAAHSSALITQEPPLTREDIVSAISEGLVNQSSISREIELNKDDLFEAVASGLHEAAASSQLNVGDQIIDRLRDLVQDMKDEFKQYSVPSGHDAEQVLDSVKDGLQVLRTDIESYVDKAADVTGKEEIISTVKEGFRLLQADLEHSINEAALRNSSSRGNPDTPELLDAMEKEFEHLRSTLSGLLIRTETSGDKAEILDAIHEIGTGTRNEVDTTKLVQAVREEFENIRDSIGMSLVKSESSEKDDIISALRESFENLQAETMQKRDGNESSFSSTSELLEAFNDGVDTIRADLETLIHKSDEQSSSEVLDALKEGLESIKFEMEALRTSQKEFEETSTTRGQELILANESNISNDIESLKVLITQLQIKVESIEANQAPAPPSEHTLKREHLDEVLSAVRDVHGSVAESNTRREDAEIIETLLRDTVARFDEINIPPTEDLAKAEQVMNVEVVVSELKDAIAEVAARLETESCTKADFGTLETLLKDLWVAVEESKSQAKDIPEGEEAPEPVVKSDLQTVEAMIFEVKTSIEELKLPDVETLPAKSDIEALSELINAFKEKVDTESELTAQAFEARKVEHGGLAEKIEEAKVVVADLREELKSKLDGSEEGLSELKTLLEGLAVSSGAFTTVESVKELSDLINREFERARGEQEVTKLETEERDAAIMVKQDEARATIVADLEKKVDERVDHILSKYDELQESLDKKFSETEERHSVNVEHLTSTKGLAEDIKLIIGAMGNSVTESCERMGDDTKTLFTKISESYDKMEEMHNEIKEFNELSKAELEKTSAATDRVEGQILEYHPQILGAIKDILMLVGQHYEHSQKTNEELSRNLSAIPATIPTMLPALLPAPPEPREIIIPDKYDDTELHSKLDLIMNHAESTKNIIPEKYDDSELRSKLDMIMSHTESAKNLIPEKYDDSELHSKLDMIMSHAENTSKTMAGMDKLDQIHEKVMETSREITEMVATQSRLVIEDYERKKREAEDAAYALERRLAQKEKVESEILSLNDEKESLLKIIQAMKTEKEQLTKQNTKLGKELHGLETALDIRQHEMELFEERAQGLEKRILAGVFDHARTMLLKESGRGKSRMSLRRIPSYGSNATRTSRATSRATSTNGAAKDTRSLVSNGVEMGLKRRQPAKNPAYNGSTVSSNGGKERRILSLSHVTGNRGPTDRHVTAPVGTSGLTNLKRSHSVRSNLPSRKTSWGTSRDFEANKENESFLEEDESFSVAHSDAGTERTADTGHYLESVSHDSESTISASRQPSYASTTNGLVAEHNGSIIEEDCEEEDQVEHNHQSYEKSEHSDAEAPEDDDEDVDDEGDYQTTIDEHEEHSAFEEDLSDLETPPGIKIPGQNDSGLGSDIQRPINV